MEKGYYITSLFKDNTDVIVAIHNKNGKGLLLSTTDKVVTLFWDNGRNPQ